MPQIHASVNKEIIDQLEKIQPTGETFSQTVENSLDISVAFQTNPIGKIFLVFGDKILTEDNTDCLCEMLTESEAEIFRIMIKNVEGNHVKEWREKVKIPDVLKRLL